MECAAGVEVTLIGMIGRWLLRLAGGAAGLAAVGLSLLYAFQGKLLYVPNFPGRDYESSPDLWGLEFEDVNLTAADGTQLHAWLLRRPGSAGGGKPTGKRPCILFFQENAGNISHRLPYIHDILYHLDCVVFMPSYRGYGISEGVPSQQGLEMDAEAALQHVLARDDVDPEKVVAFGRSLGGAVALHLAAARRGALAGLVLENTFLSVEEMVERVFPPLGVLIGHRKPLNFLVTNKWRNRDKIQAVANLHTLLLCSTKDEIVPADHMRELQRLRGAERCSWVEFPEAHHMDTWIVHPSLYWAALGSFWQQHIAQR